jgi:hypothetical protein
VTKLVLSIALVIAGVAAATLALLHFTPMQVAVQRAVGPGELSPKHAYLANRCKSCHESTVGVTVAKCTACHATSERLLGRQPTAFHASISECAACHVEHQLTNIRPLVMDHVELARVGARTLARESRTDADSAATLKSLETWLRVRGPGQFAVASARESLNCAGCHDRRDPHFKNFGSDCAQCHAFETWKVAGYKHPSSTSRQCVQCHKAPPSHTMGHFSMVSRKFAGKEHARVDQCFECHNTTSWNDIVDVGFYKHH